MRLASWQQYLKEHQPLADGLLGVSQVVLTQRTVLQDIQDIMPKVINPPPWQDMHWMTPRQKRIRAWFTGLDRSRL